MELDVQIRLATMMSVWCTMVHLPRCIVFHSFIQTLEIEEIGEHHTNVYTTNHTYTAKGNAR